MSLLETGLATPDFRWDPVVFDVDGPTGHAADGSRPAFLRIATRLLNDCGYLGTSVDSIVDELNVTKGSFYHHLASKDELILEAVRTNFQRIAAAIAQARAGGGSQAQQLSSAIATLVDLQFRREWPLLRSTAYASLPPALRAEVGGGSRRTALTFASMLIDGITEGSVRAVDPLIASNVINSTLYSALGLREWSTQQRNERAIALYASTLMFGIFDPDVLTKLDRD
jgi:AcrR family transcriptional regulator